MKYPRGVFFITVSEFFERFCYYGNWAILSLYMRTVLGYNDDEATEFFHAFLMLCCLFPVFGAIIADSYIGKYRTILYLSILYAAGCITLSISSVTILGLPQRAVSLIGLLFIAVGTGGIKPCVSSLGADQFTLPEQTNQLQRFFSYFYGVINAGALLSILITPILRQDVTCFGENNCFPLAFGIPAIFMLVSLCIFVIGTPLYIKKKPDENIIAVTAKCIWCAAKNKFYYDSNNQKKEHWLDYADEKFSAKQITEIKALLNVLVLLIPAPLYWALYDQQGSRWVFQATRMDGRLLGFVIKPDQICLVDSLLTIVFIPLFELYLYPLLNKLKLNTSLRKLSLGCILVAVSFVMSAILEFQLEKTYPTLPDTDESQLWLFNSLRCEVTVSVRYDTVQIPSVSGRRFDLYPINNNSISIPFNVSLTNGCGDLSLQTSNWSALVTKTQISSFVISDDRDKKIVVLNSDGYDNLEKNLNGLPKARLFYASDYNDYATMKFVSSTNKTKIIKARANRISEFYTFPIMTTVESYNILRNNSEIMRNFKLNPGSIVTLLVRDDRDHITMSLGSLNLWAAFLIPVSSVDVKSTRKPNGQNILPCFQTTKTSIIDMVPPNSIHILWQIPQAVVITISAVLFSVTGLEFCFTQAPDSMKSIISAVWLLTTTFGNLIVVVLSGIKVFKRQAYEFLLYAVLMAVDMVIFMVFAKNYRYRSISD